jgi:ribosomal-protein-alanine N-acetyltransferase
VENNPAVILESERLLFRPHVAADKDAYCAMDKDPEVRRYIGGKPRTHEEAERRFLGALKPVQGQLSMWAAILKADGSYIGRCGIYPHFNSDSLPIPGEAALGYYIAREHWGKGYATEAGKAFIAFGFNELNINRIITAIEVGNDASVRVIEKLGFELVWTETGGLREFLHYSLRKEFKRI